MTYSLSHLLTDNLKTRDADAMYVEIPLIFFSVWKEVNMPFWWLFIISKESAKSETNKQTQQL